MDGYFLPWGFLGSDLINLLQQAWRLGALAVLMTSCEAALYRKRATCAFHQTSTGTRQCATTYQTPIKKNTGTSTFELHHLIALPLQAFSLFFVAPHFELLLFFFFFGPGSPSSSSPSSPPSPSCPAVSSSSSSSLPIVLLFFFG